MSKHKHPQSHSNRVSRWNMGNLPLSYPGWTPGVRVVWQTPTGRKTGVLANPVKLLDGSMYRVIEDGQSEPVLVKCPRREKTIMG